MKRIVLGTGLFILISFAAQSISHFVINAEHYASITFMRAEPVFILGFLTMIMQGLVLSHFFKIYSGNKFTLKKGFIYGLQLCAFFVSYQALVEPAKYQVPSITSWILVEGSVGVVQFTLFGVLLSMLFKKIKV